MKKYKNKILKDDGLTLVVESTKGRTFMIDKEDEYILKNYWFVNSDGYVRREFGRIHLHRLLMDCPDNLFVDHKDLNPSNNCKNNLRICTKQQNQMNRRSQKNSSSKYKGVSLYLNSKWRSMIKINNKQYHIGYFNTEEEAAEAYNKKALELFGEFSLLNMLININ